MPNSDPRDRIVYPIDKLMIDSYNLCLYCLSRLSVWKLWMSPYSRSFTIHYENMPMHYTSIFHGCKNHNFQKKICDIFLIFAQNTDCGYMLEPPH